MDVSETTKDLYAFAVLTKFSVSRFGSFALAPALTILPSKDPVSRNCRAIEYKAATLSSKNEFRLLIRKNSKTSRSLMHVSRRGLTFTANV